jgi:hypothetical protein
MEATQAKAPAPKMKKRASFSRVGRLMARRGLRGRVRIQMSVMMLKVEVAGGSRISGVVRWELHGCGV